MQQKQSLERNYRALNAYAKKIERSKTNHLTLYLRKPKKKKKQMKPKVSSRREIMKIRVEINEAENRKTTENQ